jgi:hypothetical protein
MAAGRAQREIHISACEDEHEHEKRVRQAGDGNSALELIFLERLER